MAESEISQKSNYEQLGAIILEGTQVLTQVFKSRYKKVTKGQDWEDTEKCRQNFIKNLGRLEYQRALPIQQNSLKSSNLNEWDLTLLAFILTNVDWGHCSRQQRSQIKNENFKIHQLRHMRNNYAHSSGRISATNFHQWKDKAESSIKFLEDHYKNLANLPQLQSSSSKIKCESPKGSQSPSSQNSTKKFQTELVNPNSNQVWSIQVDETDELIEINEEYLKSEDFTLVARGCLFFAQRHLVTNNEIQIDEFMDFENVVEYLQTAADAGNPVGLYNLGVLYLQGQGVSKDLEKAFALFQEAAKINKIMIPPFGIRCLGSAEAQFAIGKFYDGLGIRKNKMAAESSFNLAVIGDNGYGPAVLELIKMCQETGDPSKDHFEALCKGRGKMNLSKDKDNSIEFILDFQNPMPYVGHDPSNSYGDTNEIRKIWLIEREIRQRAQDSSQQFTRKLSSFLTDFSRGLSALEELTEDSQSNLLGSKGRLLLKRESLHSFANSFKIGLLKNYMSESNEMLLSEIVHEVLYQDKNMTQLSTSLSLTDRNARICQIHSLLTFSTLKADHNKLTGLLKESRLKYPLEPFFHLVFLSHLESTGDFDQGLKVALESSKKFPENYEIIYRQAKLSFCQWTRDGCQVETKKVKEAYSKFVQMAPRDHWLLPEAYYVQSYLKTLKKTSLKGFDLYRQGLHTENELLSCFLPYDSVAKVGVQERRTEILLGRKRLLFVQKYREQVKARSGQRSQVACSSNPRNLVVKTQLIAPVDVRTVRWTIVEDISFGVTEPLQAIVCSCDDSWEFEWVCFYGVNQFDLECQKIFSFGSVLDLEPDLRVFEGSGDQVWSGFGVSNPDRIRVCRVGLDEPICRLCFLTAPTITCGGCQRSSYCGHECLKEDWDILKHHLICQVR